MAYRAVSRRGSHRGRLIARHVATGARAAATLHICRGRPFDLDARAGHRSPVWQCCVHWVPDHPKVLARLLWSLPAGGVLAVQMPDNTNESALMLMEKVAASAGITRANMARNDLPRPEDYSDLLRPLCSNVDIWHICYNHLIENHEGVVERFKGSGLRPFFAP